MIPLRTSFIDLNFQKGTCSLYGVFLFKCIPPAVLLCGNIYNTTKNYHAKYIDIQICSNNEIAKEWSHLPYYYSLERMFSFLCCPLFVGAGYHVLRRWKGKQTWERRRSGGEIVATDWRFFLGWINFSILWAKTWLDFFILTVTGEKSEGPNFVLETGRESR